MKKGWYNFIIVMSALVSVYLMFNFIFFVFLGHVGSDTVIGFSFFFLIFMIYQKGRKMVYNYLWSLSKNVYINFFSLLNLLASFRKLVIGYNVVYLEFFRYSFVALNIVSKNISNIFNELNFTLVNNFLVNYYLTQLKLKYNFISSVNNTLPVEYNFRNNCVIELNIFLTYDSMIFIFK